jgi:hypothetical protein
MAFMTDEEREIRQRSNHHGDLEGTGTNSAPPGSTATYDGAALSPWDAYNPNALPQNTQRNNIFAPSTYQDQARARQQALIDQLHGIASGSIKSPAQQLFEQQVGQAQNQAVGTAASLRDVGPGGQQQIAGQNQGTQLQTEQRAAAEQALAGLYGQQRQGDLGLAQTQAEGLLGNNALNDNYNSAAIARLLGIDLADTDRQQSRARADLGFDVDQQAQQARLLQGLAGAGGTAFDYIKNRPQGATPSLAELYGDK